MSEQIPPANPVPDSANQGADTENGGTAQTGVTPVAPPGEPDPETAAGKARSALGAGEQYPGQASYPDDDPGAANLGRNVIPSTSGPGVLLGGEEMPPRTLNIAYTYTDRNDPARSHTDSSGERHWEDALAWILEKFEHI